MNTQVEQRWFFEGEWTEAERAAIEAPLQQYMPEWGNNYWYFTKYHDPACPHPRPYWARRRSWTGAGWYAASAEELADLLVGHYTK